MTQLCLFDLAQVAPTRGEQRAARAETRREEAKKRKSANQHKRWCKADARRRLEEAQPAVTCCLYWYAPGSGWTHCHKCRNPLRPALRGSNP